MFSGVPTKKMGSLFWPVTAPPPPPTLKTVDDKTFFFKWILPQEGMFVCLGEGENAVQLGIFLRIEYNPNFQISRF